MKLKEITKEWLEANGFDGFQNGADCYCEIADFMPCKEPTPDCTPGYKVPCDCGDHSFHIEPKFSSISRHQDKQQSESRPIFFAENYR